MGGGAAAALIAKRLREQRNKKKKEKKKKRKPVSKDILSRARNNRPTNQKTSSSLRVKRIKRK